MDARRRQWHFVSVMAKHLPPSASTLRLLDIDGRSGEMLAETRRDISLRRLPSADLPQADLESGSQDAIVAYDIPLADSLLGAALRALPGSSQRITFCSTQSQASGPMISRAIAVWSGEVKYGCAPWQASRESSSILGPSAAITVGGAGSGCGPA